jgi:hypothetical protein
VEPGRLTFGFSLNSLLGNTANCPFSPGVQNQQSPYK